MKNVHIRFSLHYKPLLCFVMSASNDLDDDWLVGLTPTLDPFLPPQRNRTLIIHHRTNKTMPHIATNRLNSWENHDVNVLPVAGA